jgi:putative transposase
VLTVVNPDGSTPNGSLIDEIVREGARRMLAAALEAEVNSYVAELAGERDECGRRLVVRNGYHLPRKVTTAAGVVEVKAPRVNDKRIDEATGERRRFSSVILPPWARKSPKISEVLPLLYLHGLSSGDFVPALEQFLGSSAGLSPATVTRLTQQWQADHKAFGERDLTGSDYVYVWADGIHLRIRLSEAKSCVLVVMGVRADGTKELIAMADGYRESAESWADLLRDSARCGMRAPVLAVGDGALGFWKALAEVFPETRHQRCWVHKTANVLNALPTSAQPGARKSLQDIYNAEDRERAVTAVALVREDLRCEVAQGGPEDHRRRRRTADVLRLPCGTLGSPAYDQSHRIDLRNGAAADQGHQGCRQRGRRSRDGLQARRIRPGPLASGQRTSPRRPRASRSPLRTRPSRRTPRAHRRLKQLRLNQRI